MAERISRLAMAALLSVLILVAIALTACVLSFFVVIRVVYDGCAWGIAARNT